MLKRSVFLLLVSIFFSGCGVEEDDKDPFSPTITSTVPSGGSLSVPKDAVISAIFSEKMDGSSINTSTFMLKSGFANISGSVSYSGTTAAFTPDSVLPAFRVYSAIISTGVRDQAGNTLKQRAAWTFSTISTMTSVSYSADIQPIFDSSCVRCHVSGGGSSFLPLSEGSSYGNLVNQSSNYTRNWQLVVPGSYFDSVLYQRVNSGVLGNQMPMGGPYLTSDKQDLIKTWISEGAYNN